MKISWSLHKHFFYNHASLHQYNSTSITQLLSLFFPLRIYVSSLKCLRHSMLQDVHYFDCRQHVRWPSKVGWNSVLSQKVLVVSIASIAQTKTLVKRLVVHKSGSQWSFMKTAGIAGDEETLPWLTALVITSKLRDIPAGNVLNFKTSGAKIAKGKITRMATSVFALDKRESRLHTGHHLSTNHEPIIPSIKGKSQTSSQLLTHNHGFSKKMDRAKLNPRTRVSEAPVKHVPSLKGSPVI